MNKSINLIGEDRDTTIIDGNGSRHVVMIIADRVAISRFTMRNSRTGSGIYLHSNNNIILGNNILNNYYGIHLKDSNNIILDNIVSNNTYGISIALSNNNTVSGNIISNNSISLVSSSNNTVSYNSFFNGGLNVWNSYQNTVYNNTVNGKPLVYLEEESDKVIDEDAGQVILVNCENITIQNQELSNTADAGVELFKTHNCLISGNNISNNGYDIYGFGIYLYYSNNNTILGNNINSNKGSGIFLCSSSNNNILGNKVSKNTLGIELWSSNDNITSNNNTIYGNNIILNNYGISLDFSYFNVIKYNNFIMNFIHAAFCYESLSHSFSNCWNRNYWGMPRILPKPILGLLFPAYGEIYLWLNFDWRPSLKPY